MGQEESEAGARAAWRAARLASLEEDQLQAQLVIEQLQSGGTETESRAEDNAHCLHSLDAQGNITGELQQEDNRPGIGDTDSEMTTSEDCTTGSALLLCILHSKEFILQVQRVL